MSTWTWPSLLRSRLQNSSIVIIHSHFSFVFLIFLLPLLSLCVHVSVEGERPLAGVSSFFLLCGSWRSDSGCRVWECPCLFSFWPALQAGTLNGHLRATEKRPFLIEPSFLTWNTAGHVTAILLTGFCAWSLPAFSFLPLRRGHTPSCGCAVLCRAGRGGRETGR